MKLTLKRTTEINNTLLGELYIDNKFFCYTLEDKIRSIKIKHETCIPEGKYKVILTLSQRFKTILPLLIDVPNFEGIRIHPGNTIADTSGCILVGSAISNEKLLHSKTTFQKLLIIIKQVLKKEPVEIEVFNPIQPTTVLPIIEEPKVVEVPKIVDVVIQTSQTENAKQFVNLLNHFIKWLIKYF